MKTTDLIKGFIWVFVILVFGAFHWAYKKSAAYWAFFFFLILMIYLLNQQQ